MARTKLEIRNSGVIYHAAVGGLVYQNNISLVACDIRYWKIDDCEPVHMPRMSRELAGKKLYKPPAVRDIPGGGLAGGSIPMHRFPKWLYCPACKRMTLSSSRDPSGQYFYTIEEMQSSEPLPCKNCSSGKQTRPKLKPMPYVVVCSKGHLGDVPWHYIVHREEKNQKRKTCKVKTKLYYDAGNKKITCRDCKAVKDLSGIKERGFVGALSCDGRQPWCSFEGPEKCDSNAGAGTLRIAGILDRYIHQPVIRSAMDIPPESRIDSSTDNASKIRNHPEFRQLAEFCQRHGKEHRMVADTAKTIALSCNAGVNDVWHALGLGDGNAEVESQAIETGSDFRSAEFDALLAPVNDYQEFEKFITRSETHDWKELLKRPELDAYHQAMARKVSQLIAVPRLREVQTLIGFIRSVGPNPQRILVDLTDRSDWLPVAEVFGEGIFIELDSESVQKWSIRNAVQERSQYALSRFKRSNLKEQLKNCECDLESEEDKNLSAFMLLHTLSHLLISEIAFECGYKEASLRERLYLLPERKSLKMGILLYLGSGEPAGSLGGLAELAAPDKFLKILARCVEKSRWCSLDPVCAEHEGRGTALLNRAACHACCLVSETSCECGNVLLDRALVTSVPSCEGAGFFDD